MRVSGIMSAVAALLLLSTSARAEDCKGLQKQSAQIACLQRELDSLRGQVAELRATQFASETRAEERMIDDKIRQALADLERRLEEKAKPRVHRLDQ